MGVTFDWGGLSVIQAVFLYATSGESTLMKVQMIIVKENQSIWDAKL